MAKRGRTNVQIRTEYAKICELIKDDVDDDSVLYGIHLALGWVLGYNIISPSIIGELVRAKSSKPPV
jgi:hypothetical protein